MTLLAEVVPQQRAGRRVDVDLVDEVDSGWHVRGWTGWPVLVVALAILASVGAAVYVHATGRVGLFLDEGSHLLHARRVFDSRTPGLGQIGQYWPPLFQVLELPFVWIDPLYKSGWAATIPGMLCYVGGVAGAYRLGAELTRHRAAGAVAALAFGANPNLLYLQTTAMLESAIAFGLVWSAAMLARFCRTGRFRDIVLAGLAGSVACWTHYGAWGLPVYGALVVVVACRSRGFGWRKTETFALGYALACGYAAVLWMAWNFYIQHDPLYFAHLGGQIRPDNPDAVFLAGRPGNLAYALLSYGLAVYHVIGPVGTGLALVVLFVGFFRRQFIHPVGAGLAASGFAVTLLTVKGGSLGSPTFAKLAGLTSEAARADPNIRYALWILPFVAAAAALVAGRSRMRQAGATVALLAGLTFFAPGLGGVATAADPAEYAQGQTNVAVGNQLKDIYAGGGILMSSRNGADGIVWASQLDTREFITEFNPKLFALATTNPAPYTRYVLVAPRDLLGHIDASRLEGLGYRVLLSYDVYADKQQVYTLWERAS